MLKINVKTQKITTDLRGYKADSSPKKRKENKAEKGKGRSLSQCPAGPGVPKKKIKKTQLYK